MYREIPFYDGPEAVWVETVSGKTGLVGPDEYAAKRPFMLMIDPDGWLQLKLFIMATCHKAGVNCDTELESVATAFKKADQLVEKIFGGTLK